MDGQIDKVVHQYMKNPGQDPLKDLREILSDINPEWNSKRRIRKRLLSLGYLQNWQDREAETGSSTAEAEIEDSEEAEGSKEERTSESGLPNSEEVGLSEVQVSDVDKAGPSDAENSDEEPSIQISLLNDDNDGAGSSEGRIPVSSLLNHDSDGGSTGGLIPIYSLLNPPDTLEPEIQLEPDLPQLTMRPVF